MNKELTICPVSLLLTHSSDVAKWCKKTNKIKQNKINCPHQPKAHFSGYCGYIHYIYISYATAKDLAWVNKLPSAFSINEHFCIWWKLNPTMHQLWILIWSLLFDCNRRNRNKDWLIVKLLTTLQHSIKRIFRYFERPKLLNYQLILKKYICMYIYI